MNKIFKEFSDFLKQYNVIGLAVAIIIGGKLNQLVTSIVNDLLMPAIFQPVLTRLHLGSIEEIEWRGIYWGKVLSATLDFLIVAFLVFLLVGQSTEQLRDLKKAPRRLLKLRKRLLKK